MKKERRKETPSLKPKATKKVQYEVIKHMEAEVYDMKDGARHYSGLVMIRMISDTYTFAIMDDHAPLVGELKGSLVLVSDEEEVRIDDVQGFYVFKNNTLRFIRKGSWKRVIPESQVSEVKKRFTRKKKGEEDAGSDQYTGAV